MWISSLTIHKSIFGFEVIHDDGIESILVIVASDLLACCSK